jgi:hypothetical protein
MFESEQASVLKNDQSLEELTRKHPVKALLGEWYDRIQSGFKPGSYHAIGSNFFMGSPAQNSEAESLFYRILQVSVQVGSWVGHDIGRMLPNCAGLVSAVDNGLICLKEHKGKFYALPKEELLKFLRERLNLLSQSRLDYLSQSESQESSLF